jgi:Family of unknown function (DUF6232)
MTTYYRDDSVLVNSDSIIVDGRWYPLADLDDVWLEEGAWQAERALAVLIMRSLVAAAGVALLAAIVAVVSAPHHPGHGRVPDWVVWAYLMASPVVLGVLIVAAERTKDRGLRTLRLCAQRDGRAIPLYTTTNARRFGQVHRAVLRALERNGR